MYKINTIQFHTSFINPTPKKKPQDSVNLGDALALPFDQCCFCPDKTLPKWVGSLKDRSFYPQPDPPYPTHT